MNTHGVRILDKIGRIVCVKLGDILEEIQNGELLHWSIIYIYGMGRLDDKSLVVNLEEKIKKSEKGVFMSWQELNMLSSKIDKDDVDIFDIVIIGCSDSGLLRKYDNDQEMYEICDITIAKIDSGYWEVFSKDDEFIKNLSLKFKEIELLESDYER